MSWRAITEADILQRLSGDELTALRAAALADGQSDPVAGEIDSVTELIRGYVGACASNTLGAAGTIPERLMAAAADILAVRIPTRAAGTLIDPESARSRAHSGAITLLEQVAVCKFSVDVPTAGTESTEDTAAASPSISERDVALTRSNQDGI